MRITHRVTKQTILSLQGTGVNLDVTSDDVMSSVACFAIATSLAAPSGHKQLPHYQDALADSPCIDVFVRLTMSLYLSFDNIW